ncbi:extracellular solute-binding protein [Caldicoprobacter algeriensis]|uniref:extracellular solute-binding protein n=1 Tax=Caldicoprobacter algeriensis TaxID=699281 RepID=UPI00207ADE32|nr:extracellular solute-binding protein [Caldicoprobacter algeriensis]MCM8901465.1 extracellular solute-binding protein [Caldicoprobacter algeriensis]
MVKEFRKFLVIILTAALLLSLLAGCGAKTENESVQEEQSSNEQQGEGSASGTEGIPSIAEDAKNPITFSIFVGGANPMKGDAPILAEMAKRTGVSFDIRGSGGQDSEILSIMLASKDYTDIVMLPRDNLFYRYLSSGDLIDLKPLLQKYAPTVYKLYNLPQNGSLIDRFSNEEGKLYYLTQDLELLREGEEPVENLEASDYEQVWLPWHRVLYVLYPEVEEVYGKKITNLDELYDALVAYKEKYPDNDHYAMSMSSTMGGHMIWAALSMYGYKVLSHGIYGGVYATKDGQNYMYVFKAPELLEFFKFLNKLYREGLMDPEGPIQTHDQFQQKMNSGKVFSMIGNWDVIYTANDSLLRDESTKDKIYIPQKLMAPGVTQHWQYNYAYTGNNAMVVTNKCPDPARLFRFFEWLYSDEGLVLNGWGIEGEDYIINSEGKRDISPEIDQQMQADPEYGWKRGLQFFQGVINIPAYTTDGQGANNWMAPYYKSEEGKDPRDLKVRQSPLNWHNDWVGTFYKDYDEVDIYVDAESPEAMALAQAQALIDDAVSKMVLAESEVEVEQIYQETLQQMETNGIALWEKYINDTIASRRSNNNQ